MILRPSLLIVVTAALAVLLAGAASSDARNLKGSTGVDRLIGGPGNDRLWGRSGRDHIRGAGGRDRLWGGSDRDRLWGGSGRDRLWGGPGADRLYGGRDPDRLHGGPAGDRIYGGLGADRVYGGAGNDLIHGGLGSDRLAGGSGNDRFLTRDQRRDTITCGSGRDTVIADRFDRVGASCERVVRPSGSGLPSPSPGAGTAPGSEVTHAPPTPGGYFPLLAVRASLPSGASCAARVRRSRWEPRPGNYAANHRTPAERLSLAPHTDFDSTWNSRHRTRITGRFVGTTDELIQWAACKWGLSDELLRAQVALESTWRQDAAGDLQDRSSGSCAPQDSSDPCPTSFGLLQNKWFFHKPGYPMLRTMTPFHLEWSAAQLRGCYDGRKRGFPGGDMEGCLSNWFSGGWRDAQGREYVERVNAHRSEKLWLTWENRAAEVSYQTTLRPLP